ncbi:MAG: hypothetical protein CMJ54_11920, partial [Planctomycetaceae bacterium]|nr:hypothetical protein [Planctomycetaceae bacterium]
PVSSTPPIARARTRLVDVEVRNVRSIESILHRRTEFDRRGLPWNGSGGSAGGRSEIGPGVNPAASTRPGNGTEGTNDFRNGGRSAPRLCPGEGT